MGKRKSKPIEEWQAQVVNNCGRQLSVSFFSSVSTVLVILPSLTVQYYWLSLKPLRTYFVHWPTPELCVVSLRTDTQPVRSVSINMLRLASWPPSSLLNFPGLGGKTSLAAVTNQTRADTTTGLRWYGEVMTLMCESAALGSVLLYLFSTV